MVVGAYGGPSDTATVSNVGNPTLHTVFERRLNMAKKERNADEADSEAIELFRGQLVETLDRMQRRELSTISDNTNNRAARLRYLRALTISRCAVVVASHVCDLPSE